MGSAVGGAARSAYLGMLADMGPTKCNRQVTNRSKGVPQAAPASRSQFPQAHADTVIFFAALRPENVTFSSLKKKSGVRHAVRPAAALASIPRKNLIRLRRRAGEHTPKKSHPPRSPGSVRMCGSKGLNLYTCTPLRWRCHIGPAGRECRYCGHISHYRHRPISGGNMWG
jgi:hypothetical protein